MGFCSVHSHFEFLDTANALPNPHHDNKPDLYRALKAYADAGYSCVAITEHGSVTSYEDIRDLLKNEKYPKLPLKVLFGIEAYVAEDTESKYRGSHVILIAKDLEGYHQLTNAINHSVYNTAKKRMEMPIDVIKQLGTGHILCSSACIGGIFGNILIKESNDKRAYDRAVTRLERYNYQELMQKQAEFDALTEKSKITYKTRLTSAKRALTKAEKLKDTAGIEEINAEIASLERLRDEVEDAKAALETRKEERAELAGLIKEANKHKLKNAFEIYQSYKPLTIEDRTVLREKMQAVYKDFSETFGDDFYIEIQNHLDEKEQNIYNTLVSFCKDEGLPVKFIASNDTHISCTKTDANIENMNRAREIMKMVRMKIYDAYSEAEEEYCIKSEDEIKDYLKRLQEPYFDLLSGQEEMSQITDEDIDTALANTHIIDNYDYAPFKEDHYPAVQNSEARFEASIAAGIKRIFGCTEEELPEEYRERLKTEREIMHKMRVIDYHVIVEDLLRFARAYGRIPENRRAEVEPFLADTDRVERFVEENGFPPATAIGVGRGSAGGSLICYCMGITGIDPIEYNLSMERYLNLERVSMPDIDSDIRKDIREDVIRHCEKLWGYVCRIGTKSYGSLRSSLDRAAEYVAHKHYEEDGIDSTGVSFEEYNKKWLGIVDAFKKKYLDGNAFAVTDDDDLTDEEKEAIEAQAQEDFAKATANANFTPEEQEICDYYRFVLGQFVQLGQHACGMIISKDALDSNLPMYYSPTKDSWQTQMTYPQAENLGYLKMDMLGLATLDIINECQQVTGDYKDMRDTVKDPNVYKMFRSGLTEGLFQMNGKRIRTYMRDELKPDCIEDIIGSNALNRPGPWDTFNVAFAKRKFDPNYTDENTIDTSYSIELTDILAPTYGCLIYQEQVMEIFKQLGGFTLGGADNVRRAMGKKKVEYLEAQKENFVHGNDGWTWKYEYDTVNGNRASVKIKIPVSDAKTKEECKAILKQKILELIPTLEGHKKPHGVSLDEAYIDGCARRGIPEDKAMQLYDIMVEFAKYAFNKSHSTAYAITACATAYYKYYYPAVFYAATFNMQDNKDKRANILNEAMGYPNVKVAVPSVTNCSYKATGTFGQENILRLGLGDIKGFGTSMDIDIKYADNLYDFCIANPEIKSSSLKTLIQAGFFDAWGYTRHSLLTVCEGCLKEASKEAPSEDYYAENVYPILHKRENFIACQTSHQYFECLKWEKDLFGIGINIEDGIQTLNSHNAKPYDEFNDSYGDFIVIDCSDAMKTKSSNRTYYQATLCDVAGNVFTRRFNEPLTSACVHLKVFDKDHKYNIMELNDSTFRELTKKQENLNFESFMRQCPRGLEYLSEQPTPVRQVPLINDETGKKCYVNKKVYGQLKSLNMIYEGDFHKLFNEALAVNP